MTDEGKLNEFRMEIERVTSQILDLVERRLDLAREIGRLKEKLGMPVRNKAVEMRLRERVLENCKKTGLDEKFAMSLLDLLVEESVRAQRTDRVEE